MTAGAHSNPANPHLNRLAAETSPYLQQHAGNPVDWRPWGDEALAAARAADRPILLSVGYSACHWCHVMAHECFEDEETAALMNRHFVNIKVDREERPDVDQIYQSAHQLIAQGAGGWPLTMFLTPDGKPFYGGTYFPKRPKYGRPGFDQLLARIGELWATQRADLVKNGDAVVQALASTAPRQSTGAADTDALDRIARQSGGELIAQMMRAFDARYGGFGRAPKFPQPAVLAALLRGAVGTNNDRARDAVLLTLRRMADGGLYDHLGGGFCRYSTDERWLIPHFEKMLYDNGPLLRLYAEAWQLTRDPLFREVCEGVAGWMIREMQSRKENEGGYYSSLDADSEGEEGKFYVWERSDVAAHLTTEEFMAVDARYGLDGVPNFEGPGAGMQQFGTTLARPAWHLHVARPIADVALSTGMSESDVIAAIDRARTKLVAVRETRIRPGRDDKILTSWNALAIDGMLFAARVFDRADWAASARSALEFVRSTLWRVANNEGRLLATYKDGHAHLNAYLDDHAFLLAALVEAMQHGELQVADVEWATAIAELLLDQFEDRDGDDAARERDGDNAAHERDGDNAAHERDIDNAARERLGGGFFFTSHDHETLVMRPKPGHDNATPSGNGVAAVMLQRFGHLVGEPRYVEAAERTMALFAEQASHVPQAFATLVVAMDERLSPPAVVTLAEPPGSTATAGAWQGELARRYAPGTIVLRMRSPADERLPPAMRKPDALIAQAWICNGPQCLPPVTDLPSILSQAG